MLLSKFASQTATKEIQHSLDLFTNTVYKKHAYKCQIKNVTIHNTPPLSNECRLSV